MTEAPFSDREIAALHQVAQVEILKQATAEAAKVESIRLDTIRRAAAIGPSLRDAFDLPGLVSPEDRRLPGESLTQRTLRFQQEESEARKAADRRIS